MHSRKGVVNDVKETVPLRAVKFGNYALACDMVVKKLFPPLLLAASDGEGNTVLHLAAAKLTEFSIDGGRAVSQMFTFDETARSQGPAHHDLQFSPDGLSTLRKPTDEMCTVRMLPALQSGRHSVRLSFHSATGREMVDGAAYVGFVDSTFRNWDDHLQSSSRGGFGRPRQSCRGLRNDNSSDNGLYRFSDSFSGRAIDSGDSVTLTVDFTANHVSILRTRSGQPPLSETFSPIPVSGDVYFAVTIYHEHTTVSIDRTRGNVTDSSQADVNVSSAVAANASVIALQNIAAAAMAVPDAALAKNKFGISAASLSLGALVEAGPSVLKPPLKSVSLSGCTLHPACNGVYTELAARTPGTTDAVPSTASVPSTSEAADGAHVNGQPVFLHSSGNYCISLASKSSSRAQASIHESSWTVSAADAPVLSLPLLGSPAVVAPSLNVPSGTPAAAMSQKRPAGQMFDLNGAVPPAGQALVVNGAGPAISDLFAPAQWHEEPLKHPWDFQGTTGKSDKATRSTAEEEDDLAILYRESEVNSEHYPDGVHVWRSRRTPMSSPPGEKLVTIVRGGPFTGSDGKVEIKVDRVSDCGAWLKLSTEACAKLQPSQVPETFEHKPLPTLTPRQQSAEASFDAETEGWILRYLDEDPQKDVLFVPSAKSKPPSIFLNGDDFCRTIIDPTVKVAPVTSFPGLASSILAPNPDKSTINTSTLAAPSASSCELRSQPVAKK